MKAVVFTLGCKVNSYESAVIMGELSSLGYEVGEELSYADVYVINTCAVTAEAEKKSRQAIYRARKYNPSAKIIVTGCASQKSPSDFLKKENVTLVTGAGRKDKLVALFEEVGCVLEDEKVYPDTHLPIKTNKTRAYIKVEDGCNNFCSYCVIPYLRGRERSRSVLDVIREIEYLSPLEAIITGINLSAYNYEGNGLNRLIEGLVPLNCRIRLGSLEVNVIDEELLAALKKLKDFAPHFHLSLQSGSDAVLKSMNRHYTRAEFIDKCRLIREYFPTAALTTDIIVGYSTETETDFEGSLDLAREVGFADIHAFPYSKREGTAGAKLKELPHSVKSERMARMLELKKTLRDKFIESNIGKTEFVVLEEEENGYAVGYTGNYIRCYIKGEFKREKIKVKILSPYGDGVIGVEEK